MNPETKWQEFWRALLTLLVGWVPLVCLWIWAMVVALSNYKPKGGVKI